MEKLPLRSIPPKQSLGPSRSHGHGRPWFFHSCPFPATPGSPSFIHRHLPQRRVVVRLSEHFSASVTDTRAAEDAECHS